MPANGAPLAGAHNRWPAFAGVGCGFTRSLARLTGFGLPRILWTREANGIASTEEGNSKTETGDRGWTANWR